MMSTRRYVLLRGISAAADSRVFSTLTHALRGSNIQRYHLSLQYLRIAPAQPRSPIDRLHARGNFSPCGMAFRAPAVSKRCRRRTHVVRSLRTLLHILEEASGYGLEYSAAQSTCKSPGHHPFRKPSMHPLCFSSSSRILVFAPHPDDESLATGGVLWHASR